MAALTHAGRALLAACLLAALPGPALAGPSNVKNLYNTANTIWVQIGLDWGGVISGIYYWSSGSWSSNLVYNANVGTNCQVALYQGPHSAYARAVKDIPPDPPCWKDSIDWSLWPWNPTQEGHVGDGAYRHCHASPAYFVAEGSSPVPWYKVRTYPYDWAGTHEECVQLEQTVYMWPSYIEVRYSLSGRRSNATLVRVAQSPGGPRGPISGNPSPLAEALARLGRV